MSRLMIIIMIVPLFFFIQCGTVLANGMPYNQRPGDISGTIVPVKEEKVEILKEELNIDIQSSKSAIIFNVSTYADVTARYTIVNNSSSFLEIPVVFPQPASSRNWEVKLNDEELALNTEKEIDSSDFDFNNNRQTKWLDPFSGESYVPEGVYDNPRYDSDKIRARTFQLPLEPGKHQLEVNFKAFTGIDEKRGLNPVFMFQYLLSPAKKWGDFNNLEITVHIPFNHALKSSIPLERLDRHTWQGKFAGLPEDDLYLYFSPTEGTMGGLVNSRNGALAVLFVMVIALWVLRRYLFPRFSTRVRLPIEVLLSILITWRGYITFSREIFPYPQNAFLQMPLLGLLLAFLFIPFIIYLHRILWKNL